MTILAVLSLAVPAQAEQGNGLYEPFPSVAPGEQPARYYSQLGLRVGPQELRRGILGAGFPPAAKPAGPSRRAGVAAGGAGPAALAIALAIVLALAAAARRLARRPTT